MIIFIYQSYSIWVCECVSVLINKCTVRIMIWRFCFVVVVLLIMNLFSNVFFFSCISYCCYPTPLANGMLFSLRTIRMQWLVGGGIEHIIFSWHQGVQRRRWDANLVEWLLDVLGYHKHNLGSRSIWRARQQTSMDKKKYFKHIDIYNAYACENFFQNYLCNTLVPATDYFTFANDKFEWLATVARWIEHGAIIQCASIMDRHSLTGFWESASYKYSRGIRFY